MKFIGLLYITAGVTFVFLAVAGALALLVYVTMSVRGDDGIDVGINLILDNLEPANDD